MLKANHPARAKEFLLSCVHKAHGVYGSFGFLPPNQVLAGRALARVEGPGAGRRGGGGGRGEGRCKLRGGRMELFFRGASGTGEDHWAGRVSGTHGTEEKRDREKGPQCDVCTPESTQQRSKCHPGQGYGRVKE